MASALLQEISKDERERAVFRSRRMAETDRISNILTAEARGEKKIIDLLKSGRSPEEIIRDYEAR